MKKIAICIVVYAATLLTASELNYRAAIKAAKNTDGSDGAIVQAMFQHGFEIDVFDTVTITDKVKALFNRK